jgi:hypothetical protein
MARARGRRLNMQRGHRTTLCKYCFCSCGIDTPWPRFSGSPSLMGGVGGDRDSMSLPISREQVAGQAGQAQAAYS